MLGDRVADFTNLNGCFIGYKSYPEFDNNIFLLFFTSESKIFKNFLERLKYHPMYYKTIILDTHYLFIFQVPKEYQRNYDYVKASQYSMLDDNYKKHILKFHHYNKYDEGSNIYKILYRDESLYIAKEEEINEGLEYKDWTKIPRDIEIGERIKEEEEIFDESLLEEFTH